MCNVIEYCNPKIAILLKIIKKFRLNVTELENNKKTKLLNSINLLLIIIHIIIPPPPNGNNMTHNFAQRAT